MEENGQPKSPGSAASDSGPAKDADLGPGLSSVLDVDAPADSALAGVSRSDFAKAEPDPAGEAKYGSNFSESAQPETNRLESGLEPGPELNPETGLDSTLDSSAAAAAAGATANGATSKPSRPFFFRDKPLRPKTTPAVPFRPAGQRTLPPPAAPVRRSRLEGWPLAFLLIGLAIVGSCHFSALNVAESISGGLKASLPTVDKPGVGIIAVEGEILSSAWAVKTLRRFEEDKNVMAVVLRLDTPGGAVAPCQEIVATLRSMTKPVVVSMGSVAASGGVYLAAAGDHILANPGTLTGSIGVIMESIQVAGAMEKLGVKTFTFKSGQFKDILSPFRDMRDEEKELLQNMVLEVYEQFVAEVVKGRPNMTESQIRSIADGRIFTGQEAVRIGLIDEIGGLEEAIRKAVVLATGAYEEEPAILYDDGRGGFLQRLLSSAQTALNPSAILPKSGLKFLWRPGL